MRIGARGAAVAALALVSGCENGEARGIPRPQEECLITHRSVPLPEGLGEPSGAAWSLLRPGAFWSHNDSGGEEELFLVLPSGAAAGRVRVRRAQMRDWEDIAMGPCAEGSCLHVGDFGDNGRTRRDPIALLVVPEPHASARTTSPARIYEAEFPGDRDQDTEAMFILPDGSIYLITKGNDDPVRLYRWPTPLREQGRARLELVRELAPQPEQTGDRVTGASASPNGRWVAVRTYAQLSLYRTQALLTGGEPTLRVDLMPLGENQGEGVALADDGRVALVSESGSRHVPGTAALLHCPLR